MIHSCIKLWAILGLVKIIAGGGDNAEDQDQQDHEINEAFDLEAADQARVDRRLRMRMRNGYRSKGIVLSGP